MEIFKSKQQCCGCEACIQVCPRNCITMKIDEEGFRYPVADPDQCVQCGKCRSVCPIKVRLERAQHKDQPDTYLAYCRDEKIRLESSSGGVFSVIAEYVLNKGGIVCGAALRNGAVHHIFIHSVEELEQLRGSKYLQSKIGDCYQQVKAMLKAGRTVLFTGTGCQIEGLLHVLGQTPRDNLLTIDVFCHGVPSELAWKRNLEAIQKETGKKVGGTDFRNKRDEGWKRYHVQYRLEDGSEVNRFHGNDFFISSFIKNIDLRPSCHACAFKVFPRVSDFSIGDAWNCEKMYPEIDDFNGVSVITVNSIKAEAVFSEVCSEMTVVKTKLNTVVPPMSDSRKSVKPHPNRKKFFAALNAQKSVGELQRMLRRSRIQRIVRLYEQSGLYIYRFYVSLVFKLQKNEKR